MIIFAVTIAGRLATDVLVRGHDSIAELRHTPISNAPEA
jgi:hypothetical protein